MVEILTIFLFGIIILSIITLAVKRVQKNKAIQDQLFREFGFIALRQGEKALDTRIKNLMPRYRKTSRAVDIYCLERSEGKIYIFDLCRGGRNSSKTRSIAVISSYLSLPRFSLYSRINLGGFLGNTLNYLIKSLIDKELAEVNPGHCEEFATKYQLYGNDPAAIKKLFTGSLPRRLIEKKYQFHMDGEGDTILFSRFNPQAKQINYKINRDYLQAAIDDARMLVRAFQETMSSIDKKAVGSL